MNRFFLSLALILGTLGLGACAGTMKQFPDGTYGDITTFGDTLDRSTSVYGEYDCPKNEAGKPIYGQCKLVGKREAIHGQTMAGQMLIGMTAGTVPAIVNGINGRAIAKHGQCAAGGNCGTVIQNQVGSSSVSEALIKNDVGINVDVNTCGVAGKPVCGN